MQAEYLLIKHLEKFDRIKSLNQHLRDNWLSDELTFWTNIKHSLAIQNNRSHFSETINRYIEILRPGGKSLFILENLKNLQNTQPIPFHDEKPECDLFPHLAESGQLDIAIYSFQASLNASTQAYTKTYAEDLLKIEESFKDHINSENNKSKELINESIEALNTSLQNSGKENLEKLTLDLENAKADIKNTLTAANKAILSAEPVKYWEEREKKHKEKAKTYMKFLIFTAISFILLLAYLTISVYKDKDVYTLAGIPITLPAEKVSIALLIIVTTGAIWLTRVLVKLMMTNLALEIEALERSTMIKTYIAMDNAKGEQAQEIRMLFYSTLFKPSNNNLTDDSTSPEYIRIIEAMLQKKAPDKT